MAKAIVPYLTEDHSFTASDGESSLFIRRFYRGDPKIHFLIIHGALEHSGRHMELVTYFLSHYVDVAITVYDSVGHGLSGGTRAYVDSFKDYVTDFLKVSEYVNSKNGEDTQTFICAHSLGGLVALTGILDTTFGFPFPLKGLILSSPCIRPLTPLSSISLPLLETLNKFTPKLHLPLIYRGSDLTRDSARANDFDTDSLIPKFMSVRMAKEIIDASNKIIGLSYYLKIPSLFLIAGSDKVVDSGSTVLFAHGIDKQRTKIINYPEQYHELWNESNRLEIFQTMKKWVDKELKESP